MPSAFNLSSSCTDLALQSKHGDQPGDGAVSSVFRGILKGLATVAAGLALSVLAACGGGGGTTTPAAPPLSPPTISAQPQNATVEYLAPATFNVIAAASSPVIYQWQQNGIDIPGATQASYTTSALAFTQTGTRFSAVISCSTGSITSDVATVSVKPPPLDQTTTLAGIDQNQNGVRDDIDAVIARIPVDSSQKQKLEAVARLYQTSSTGPLAGLVHAPKSTLKLNSQLQSLAQSNMQALADAINQVVQTEPQGWKYIYDLRTFQNNTKMRISQRLAEYELLNGTTWFFNVPASAPINNIAAADRISPGYIIEWFNGIWTPPEESHEGMHALENIFKHSFVHPTTGRIFEISYETCYNTNAGSNLLEVFEQKYADALNYLNFWDFIKHIESINDSTILNKAIGDIIELKNRENKDVSTFINDIDLRIKNGFRVVAVAHSQGNLFLIQVYDAIMNLHLHGEDSFKAIQVATPASRQVGPYMYITSDKDLIIAGVLLLDPTTLPVAVTAPFHWMSWGHDFINIYLGDPALSTPIINNINNALRSFPDVLPPIISSFKSIPEVITEGQTVNLLPVFTNATSASIDNGVGTVVSGGSYTVMPTSTPMAFYNLTVNGPGGTAKATTIVTVIPNTDVSISDFTAFPMAITAGQSAVLKPMFINATSASINNGVGAVTSGTSYTVWPAATTTYTLTANGTGGPKTRTITVTVTPGTSVSITSFTAAPATITAGQSAVLTPVFLNATSASISPGVVGNVTSGTGYTVTPTVTTIYTLTANGTGGPVTRTVTVSSSAYSISGTVSGAVSGATSGTVVCGSISATISSNGSYSCANVPAGNVTITPSVSGFNVTPASQSVTVTAGATATANFTATVTPSAPSIVSTKLSPGAVFDFEYPTAPITVTCPTKGTGFHLTATPSRTLASPITFTDAGVNSSGEHVFTATFTPGVPAPALHYSGKAVDVLGLYIFAIDDISGAQVDAAYIELGIVSGSKQSGITKVATDMYATSNALNIVQPYQAVVDLAAVTKKVLAVYPDVFDMVVIMNMRVDHSPTDYYAAVRNDVTGLGNLPVLDNTSLYGSSGKLAGIIRTGPGNATYRIVLHEVGHQYCCFFNNSTLDLTRGGGIHLNAISTEVVGWLGNNQYLVRQRDGSFVVTSKQNGEYSDMELYAKGLLPSNAIQPQYYVVTRDYLNLEMTPGGVLPAAAGKLITISDVEAAFGKRNPATSPTSVRLLFVVLSEEPASSALMSVANTTAVYYAGDGADIEPAIFPPAPFSYKAATRGLGTMVTQVPSPR